MFLEHPPMFVKCENTFLPLLHNISWFLISKNTNIRQLENKLITAPSTRTKCNTGLLVLILFINKNKVTWGDALFLFSWKLSMNVTERDGGRRKCGCFLSVCYCVISQIRKNTQTLKNKSSAQQTLWLVVSLTEGGLWVRLEKEVLTQSDPPSEWSLLSELPFVNTHSHDIQSASGHTFISLTIHVSFCDFIVN